MEFGSWCRAAASPVSIEDLRIYAFRARHLHGEGLFAVRRIEP